VSTTSTVLDTGARRVRVSVPGVLREVGGGFGDIGLLAPLAIALVTLNHLNATAVLAGAGIFYIATAAVYRLPVPVQPLKAVSAIAIASGLGPPGIAAAGLMIGLAFVVVSVTGLAGLLQRVVAPPVIRGIQLSIGLLLAKAALDLMAKPHQFIFGEGPLLGLGVSYAILIGVAVLGALLVFQRMALPGGTLLLLVVGAGLGIALGTSHVPAVSLGPQPLAWALPGYADFGRALWLLVVPQVGLSLGNSVLATSATARRYFGDEGARATPRRLALTMGLANLAVSPLAGMPMCHGAGGMTAHYRTGARGWLGIAVFGAFLLLLGVALGGSAPGLLALVPVAVLGGFLLYVAIEHATLVSDLRRRDDFLVAGTVAAVSVGSGNITAGVLVGIALYFALRRLGDRAAS
jgi:SulP family sulfate permease